MGYGPRTYPSTGYQPYRLTGVDTLPTTTDLPTSSAGYRLTNDPQQRQRLNRHLRERGRNDVPYDVKFQKLILHHTQGGQHPTPRRKRKTVVAPHRAGQFRGRDRRTSREIKGLCQRPQQRRRGTTLPSNQRLGICPVAPTSNRLSRRQLARCDLLLREPNKLLRSASTNWPNPTKRLPKRMTRLWPNHKKVRSL